MLSADENPPWVNNGVMLSGGTAENEGISDVRGLRCFSDVWQETGVPRLLDQLSPRAPDSGGVGRIAIVQGRVKGQLDIDNNPPWVNAGEQKISGGLYGCYGKPQKPPGALQRNEGLHPPAFVPGKLGVVSGSAPENAGGMSPRLAAAARAALGGNNGHNVDGGAQQGWQWVARGGAGGVAADNADTAAAAAAVAAATAGGPVGICPDLRWDLGQGGAGGAVGCAQLVAANPGDWTEERSAKNIDWYRDAEATPAQSGLDPSSKPQIRMGKARINVPVAVQLAVGSNLPYSGVSQARVGQGYHVPRPVVSDAAHRTQAALQAEMEGGGRGQAAAAGPQQLPYGMKPANGLSPRPAAVIRPF
jgi:hypothetical protein